VKRLPAIQRNRELFRKYHGVDAPSMMITDFCICSPRLDEAEALARNHMGKFVESNFDHHEFLSEHFRPSKATTPMRKRRRSGARAAWRAQSTGS
jgi:hypothetical protein